MLQPKKSKYRKQFRGRMKGLSLRATKLNFGDYGLKSQGRGWLTDQQIEAARVAISHYIKRAGRIWIRVFPDKPVSGKTAGAKMGGGKGDITHYVVVVKPGRILFELGGISQPIAQEAMRLAAAKLPFKTKFISRES